VLICQQIQFKMATEIRHEIDGKDYREILAEKYENEKSPQDKLARDVSAILGWVRFLGWVTIIGIGLSVISIMTVRV